MTMRFSESQHPDWRWQQARESRFRSNISIEFCFASEYILSDPYLKLAHELLCLLGKSELRLIHAVQRKKVRRELEYAVIAYRHQSENKLMNWLIQSMILADAPAEVKTALLSYDEPYFEVHSALFFDLLDRLDDENYIWNSVIHSHPASGLASCNVPTIFLECAYLGGWQRFLSLFGSVMQNFPGCSQNRLWASCPILGSYFGHTKANKLVCEVIEKRMLPIAGRTIGDLRKLYESIPIIGGGSGASNSRKPQQSWDSDHVSTCSAIVDDGMGQRRRLPAQLLSK